MNDYLGPAEGCGPVKRNFCLLLRPLQARLAGSKRRGAEIYL